MVGVVVFLFLGGGAVWFPSGSVPARRCRVSPWVSKGIVAC